MQFTKELKWAFVFVNFLLQLKHFIPFRILIIQMIYLKKDFIELVTIRHDVTGDLNGTGWKQGEQQQDIGLHQLHKFTRKQQNKYFFLQKYSHEKNTFLCQW